MASIKTQNGGKIVLRDGKVSCECCDIDLDESLEFGEFGECDCESVVCYNETTNPSPASLVIGSTTFSNETPGTELFTPTQGVLYVQYPILLPGTTPGSIIYQGYKNVVNSPTIVRLAGQVGGDIAISTRALAEPQTWPSSVELNNYIPNEGEFPCGICDVPRNGAHNVSFAFVLYPNMLCYINVISFIACFPWVRLRLSRIGAYTPP